MMGRFKSMLHQASDAVVLKVGYMLNQIPDATGVTATKNTAIGASGMGIISSMAHWNWVAIISIVVAILGFLMNLYFLRRKDKREQLQAMEIAKFTLAREEREKAESAARLAESYARIEALKNGGLK